MSDQCTSEKHEVMTNPQSIATIAAAFFLLVGMNSAASSAKSWQDQSGIAATYSHKGKKTANGEGSNSEDMTAAHRSLPFGTMVRVTNVQNGRSVVVRINDRGPFTRGRVIDLSSAAARALGFSGLARVKLSVVTMAPSTERHPEKSN